MQEKVRQAQERRKTASVGKKAIEPASDSDGSDNIDSHDESIDAFECEPTELFEADRDVAGKDLYGFRTPKKRNAMGTLAAKMPRTPITPASALQALSLDSPRTPKSHRNVLNAKTPHGQRNKLRKEVKKRLEEESEDEYKVSDDEEKDADYDASSSEDETDSDSSASESDGARAQPVAQKNKMLKNVRVTDRPIEIVSNRSARLQRRNQLAEPEFMPQSDNYFSAASTKKVRIL